ncbi:MAG: putative lipid II flippase FtsW [Coriobacteriales bacterium]
MQLPFGRKEAPSAKKGAKADDTRGRSRGAQGAAGSKAAGAKRPRAEEGSKLFGAPALIMGPRLLFILAVVALCVLGLVMIYSASSITAYSDSDFGNDPFFFFKRQVMWLAIGLVACLVCVAAPYRIWADPRVAWLIHGAAMLMLGLVAAGLGSSLYGAERSITIAGFSIQPAEFAKITLLIFIACHLERISEGKLDFIRGIAICLVVIVVTMLLIYKQPDLGTAMILFVGLLALLFLYGFPWYVIAAAVGIVGLYFAAVSFLQPYHLDRITTFLDPWADAQGAGYQSIQGFLAFGSGGVFGTGLGLSRQKYNYLPFAYNDFIFAVIGEELGLVGAAGTVLLFALFVYAGLRISHMAPDLFSTVLCGSLTTMVGFQACLNMLCVVGMAPVTGKALPFISYGGSSLLATMIIVGLVLGISRASRLDIASERRRDNLLVMEGGRSAQRPPHRAQQPAPAQDDAPSARTPRGAQQGGRLQGQAFARAGRSGSQAGARSAASASGARNGQAVRGGQQPGSKRSAQGTQGARSGRRSQGLDVELVDIAPRSGRSAGRSGQGAQRGGSQEPRRSGQGSSRGGQAPAGGAKKQVRYDGRPKQR